MTKWNGSPKNYIKNVFFGEVSDKDDQSAWFRSKWDEEYLYFIVYITDNVKFELPYSSDFGWIENEKKDTIWTMNLENTKYAGGALTNKYVNSSIPIKKGNYFLYYVSNQENSVHRWVRESPDVNFYGIAVY